MDRGINVLPKCRPDDRIGCVGFAHAVSSPGGGQRTIRQRSELRAYQAGAGENPVPVYNCPVGDIRVGINHQRSLRLTAAINSRLSPMVTV